MEVKRVDVEFGLKDGQATWAYSGQIEDDKIFLPGYKESEVAMYLQPSPDAKGAEYYRADPIAWTSGSPSGFKDPVVSDDGLTTRLVSDPQDPIQDACGFSILVQRDGVVYKSPDPTIVRQEPPG